MACSVLRIFDDNKEDYMNGILLLQKVPYYGDMDCFQMAIQDEQICLQFISKQSVQNLISKLWHREWSSESGFKTSFKVNTFYSKKFILAFFYRIYLLFTDLFEHCNVWCIGSFLSI